MHFQLHSQLKKDLILIGEFDLSLIFLLPDSDHPWIVLVPKRADIKEFYQLSPSDQVEHSKELSRVSRSLQELFNPDKLNIGMLGNMVAQLHTHIICRFKGDRCWPGSIWGSELAQDKGTIFKNIELIKDKLQLC